MHLRYKALLVVGIFVLGSIPMVASAHQPRVPQEFPVNVSQPEVSKAYYAELQGQPQVYRITSDKPFELYVNILMPDIPGQKKDVTAVVTKDSEVQPLATLGGEKYQWKRYWEKFGQDWYWQGPDYKAKVGPGVYDIKITSTNNDSKYSLAVGEKEVFNFKETASALYLIPRIKKSFFLESPINFIFSPFGWGYILAMFVFAFIFGFIYRLILRRVAKNPARAVSRNIGAKDRWVRFVLGLAVLLLTITTTWNPVLLFLSGFCFFETIFSWCGFYAAIGRNTCPIK